jgi:hypothetical protein
VPLPPLVANTLREWRLASPGSGLVFPNAHGQPLAISGIVRKAWQPVQVAAGIVTTNGKPKYPGFPCAAPFLRLMVH